MPISSPAALATNSHLGMAAQLCYGRATARLGVGLRVFVAVHRWHQGSIANPNMAAEYLSEVHEEV